MRLSLAPYILVVRITRKEISLAESRPCLQVNSMKIFSTQQRAFDALKEGEYVFCNQYYLLGKQKESRKFIIGTNEDYWCQYLNRGIRYGYEVIRRNLPCHLYIDLDVNLEKYPSIDVYHVKDMVCSHIEAGLKDHEIEERIVADSSNDKKGSLHILYKLKNIIWIDNSHVGAFMRCCMEKRVKQIPEDYETWKQFVDMGVYSRNRLFRMLGCTKKGQDRSKEVHDMPFTFENWRRCLVQPINLSDVEELGAREPDGSEPRYKGKVGVFHDHNKELSNELVQYAQTISHVRGVNYMPRYRVWCINLSTKVCPFKGKTHTNNTNYLVVNKTKRTITRRCWCQKYECCVNGSTEPEALPTDIIEKINKYDNFVLTPKEVKPSQEIPDESSVVD